MKPSEEALFRPETIARRVHELAREVSADYADTPLVLIVVLKGALPFAADLMRALRIPVTMDVVRARCYVGTKPEGTVEFLAEPTVDLRGKRVLLVEDILDTGRTGHAILTRLATCGPEDVRFCTLLDKPSRREVEVDADYIGFEIGDRFVVGYGMDYEENFRALPGIHILE